MATRWSQFVCNSSKIFVGILISPVFPPCRGFAVSGLSYVDFCLKDFALRLTIS